MAVAWQLRFAPPRRYGRYHFLNVNSKTDRTPDIGYIIIYSESFDGEALLLLPLPRCVSSNDMQRYITKQETVWGKEVRGGEVGTVLNVERWRWL